ncbi:P-loop containing nucleoside triphosphate hydrolase protein [Russula brevipes]|nr:P-loop containing nucleoside triphosphate hydrolase protein [Russula brevipes]
MAPVPLSPLSMAGTSDDKTESIGTPESTFGFDDLDSSPVGLSDPQYVPRKRKMLDSVNRFRVIGAQSKIDVPLIVALGNQSVGKTSVVEAISGVTLPRAPGTCTRCPTECQLSRSSEPWRCVVSLRITTDQNGIELAQPRRVEFGDPIFDKTLVTERIRRAQYAILNPKAPIRFFLKASSDVLKEERQLSFSSNSVCLDICGRDIDDLSFVDLPGLIPGGEPRDSNLIEQFAKSYICKESCIILLTIACETDFENQSAHRLASQYDPHGLRTIGVLTKPDRIPIGEEGRWVKMIQHHGGGKDGGIEYFSVKNPDSQDTKNGITYEQARQKEAEFFSKKEPWSNLDWLHRQRLPELEEELDKLLERTRIELAQLPSPPSSEPVGEMLQLIGSFVRSIECLVDGTLDEDDLMHVLRGARRDFKKAIHRTKPHFQPFDRPNLMKPVVLPPPSFLEDEEMEPSGPGTPIYIQDVMKKAGSLRFIRAGTRELPNNFPFIVKKRFISAAVDGWNLPSKKLLDFTKEELEKRVKEVIEDHFSQYTHGRLKQRVINVMHDHIQRCADVAEQHINFQLEGEQEPFTMNEQCFMNYRSKFLAYYKEVRQKSHSNPENTKGETKLFASKMAGPAELCLHPVDPLSLAWFLPPDPEKSAIAVMAEVRAYFQGSECLSPSFLSRCTTDAMWTAVAYRRFVDYVPMTIDRALLRGLTVGLESALLNGMGIKGPGTYEHCKSLLSEPEDIAVRRTELQVTRGRLQVAKEEVLQAFA